MARLYCDRCKYPLNVCICSEIAIINSKITIHIIQHSSESKHAKNTARILKLCHPNTHIWITNNGENLETAQEYLQHSDRSYLIYPTEDITKQAPIPEVKPLQPHEKVHLVLLDGTWKKAYKLYRSIPWLAAMPHLSVEGQSTRYQIRRVKGVSNSLSTLEAAEHVLRHIEKNIDTTPLFNSLQKMQNFYLHHSIKNYT